MSAPSGHALPKARIVGRILRMLLGVALVWMTYAVVAGEDAGFNLTVTATVLALIVFYSVVHLGVLRWARRMNPWLGALLAIAPVVLVYAFGGPVGRVASVAFIGVSLLLQAIRGDGGCEVMSVPGLLLGRRTHLVCIAFSPVDWIEHRMAQRGRAR